MPQINAEQNYYFDVLFNCTIIKGNYLCTHTEYGTILPKSL